MVYISDIWSFFEAVEANFEDGDASVEAGDASVEAGDASFEAVDAVEAAGDGRRDVISQQKFATNIQRPALGQSQGSVKSFDSSTDTTATLLPGKKEIARKLLKKFESLDISISPEGADQEKWKTIMEEVIELDWKYETFKKKRRWIINTNITIFKSREDFDL